MTRTGAATGFVVTLNFKDDCPGVPKSNTEYWGVAAAVLLLVSVTKIEVDPTGAERVTVPEGVAPPVTIVGATEKDANAIGIKFKVEVFLVEPKLAVIKVELLDTT